MTAGRPRALRCEYGRDPIGLGARRPRLFWQLDPETPGAVQRAYRLLVASDRALLAADRGDLWDSGRLESAANAHVVYAGAPLASRQRAWWKVRVYGADDGPSAWSPPASFEMGLLERGDWTARFIAAPLFGGPKTPGPVPALRREFRVERPVERARLYVTALGVYEISIAGTRVGDHELAPGWTDFARRVRYQVYDVTGLVARGDSRIDALLGDGWYAGFLGLAKSRERYGRRPALLAQLELVHDDGSTTRVESDASWRWQESALLGSDIMQGETVDARRTLRADGWRPVDVLEDPGIALDAMPGPPVRRVRELTPVAPPRRVGNPLFGAQWIYDLGQNMVGRVRLRVRGEAGTTLQLRHAEVLNPDGTLYTENLRDAAAKDTFTLAGTGEAETFEPRFSFHGFRYLEVSGRIDASSIEEVTGVVLCSDLAETGSFSCSDDDLNRLQSNIVWGQRGNFLDLPTDCPQRDERLGWTGDAQVFVRTAAFNMDVAGFFAKWLLDLRDAQGEDGRVPPVAPLPGVAGLDGMDGGPAWADAAIVCPWTIWRCFDDRRLIEECWQGMVAYLDYLLRRFPNLIRADPARDGWGGFGDWCALDGTVTRDSRIGGTPKDLIGTAFLAYSARRLAEMARAIDRPDEEKRWAELSTATREAFRRRFVTPDGLVAGNTQTSYVLPLHFDLLEPHERELTAAALARNVEEHGHLCTGFVGTPYLLQVLTGTGRLDLAYRLLLRRDHPSWLYPVVHGDATTIWERWNGWTQADGFYDPEMNSFNHYAYGAVGEYLYGTVAGLDLDPAPEASGWRRARVAPRPPLHANLPDEPLLKSARASLDTLHGRWSVDWSIEAERFRIEVRVPPGCTAGLRLPDDTRQELGPGVHQSERALDDLR